VSSHLLRLKIDISLVIKISLLITLSVQRKRGEFWETNVVIVVGQTSIAFFNRWCGEGWDLNPMRSGDVFTVSRNFSFFIFLSGVVAG